MNDLVNTTLPPLDERYLERSLIARFEEVARAYPEQVALTCEGQQMTYRELDQAAEQVAQAVLEAGGTQPEPVPLVLPHSLQAIQAVLGVLKAGKAYVPIDPFYPPALITHTLDITQAGLVITNDQYLSLAMTALVKPEAVQVLRMEAMQAETAPTGSPSSSPSGPQDLAYILFTSGSTGTPKGAMHTHQDVINIMIHQTRDLDLSPNERFALTATLGFEPSRFTLYSGLLHGGRVCLYDVRQRGLNGLAEWIAAEGITFMVTTPSAFRHMLHLAPDPRCFHSVRRVLLGGETVTAQDAQLFNRYFRPGSTLINTLGMTETGVIARYLHQQGDPVEGLSLPAGVPIDDKRILLLSPDGQPVPPGEVGEIVVSGCYLIPGYWRLPAYTAERFSPDPQDPQRRRFRTGDLGRLRPDGCLEHLGRMDAQIKIRGLRVDPAEIEGVIQQFPGVSAAAVIARDLKRGDGDQQLVAYLERSPSAAFTRAELRRFLEQQLPAHMLPPVVVFLDTLPLTPTGKVNRQALPEPEAVGQGQEHAYVAARDAVEMQLVRIWEKTLKARRVGVQDNYFELGGNSLLAAQLFAEIEKAFGRKLPLATLFQANTIEQQAVLLRSDSWTPDWSSLVPLRGGSQAGGPASQPRPPLFLAAPVGGNVLSYRDLLAHLDPQYPVYGLQALGLDGIQTVHRNIDEITQHYVQEVLKVQPQGPFYLLGSSFGGLVVYEMAQRLHDLGHSVALVVMFDAYGPGYPRRLPTTNRIKRKLFKYIRRFETHWSNLRYTDWRGRMLYMRIKLPRLFRRIQRRLRSQLDQLLHPLPAELRRVRSANRGVARRRKRFMREPRRFDGRLVLFRAEKQPLGIYYNPRLGWENVVGDQIEVYEVPGHHTSIIYEPRVPVVAKKLNEILQAVQEE